MLDAVLGSTGWKDTTLKVMIGVVLSNVGWFTVWSQEVATKSWVRENPPILRTMPTLPLVLPQIEHNRNKIDTIEKHSIETNGAIHNLDESTKDLKTVVRDLTKEVSSLQIKIAQMK